MAPPDFSASNLDKIFGILKKNICFFLYLCTDLSVMNYHTFTIPNGIKLIHKYSPSSVAHCGLLINTGSRDERPEEHGMAHFIEHVMFKGTKKRKAYHILSRLEDVGGELNAYTTKEETCIYASFLKNDYERTVELIRDIVFNSTFPEKELNKEKEIIIDEINACQDNPAELIFDDFEELIFQDNPIGRNILGHPETIRRFTKNHIHSFIRGNYHTNQMVFCSVGHIPTKRIKYLFERYFSDIPSNTRQKPRIKFESYKPGKKTVRKNTFQSHCIIGNIAYNVKDQRRIGLYLLNNILGGQGLTSRLNLALREKNGYAYNVESNYSPYFDTGVLSVYFGTDKENINKSIRLAYREFDRLKNKRLGILQMSRAKRQMIGQLARSAESNENVMLNMAKSYLIYNKVDSANKINRKIEAVTTSQLLEIANDILHTKMLSTLIFQ